MEVYAAMLANMDHHIGRLIDHLKKTGQYENTLVVFLSDNGGTGAGDNGPLRGGKATLFEGGVRVPCIVRWPKQVPAGRVCDDFLTALEVFPTLLAVAGAQPPRDLVLDGFDMMRVLRGQARTPRKEMFWEFRGASAARVGQWKWVQSQQGSGLFDLSTDIGERNDLSRDKPDVLALVKARFADWKEAMRRTEPRGPFRDY
jgi:arylsulfatase A-like enzyme